MRVVFHSQGNYGCLSLSRLTGIYRLQVRRDVLYIGLMFFLFFNILAFNLFCYTHFVYLIRNYLANINSEQYLIMKP